MVMRVGEREAKASNTSAHDAHTYDAINLWH